MYFNEQQRWAVMVRELEHDSCYQEEADTRLAIITELSCDWTGFRCSDACPKLRDKPQMTRSLAHNNFPVKLQDQISI